LTILVSSADQILLSSALLRKSRPDLRRIVSPLDLQEYQRRRVFFNLRLGIRIVDFGFLLFG
jgi:hypothetical protein